MTLDKADYYEVKALALAVSVAELERERAEFKVIAGKQALGAKLAALGMDRSKGFALNDATCEVVDATA
jgi:TctA family transporter